jgi:hypothetical protein
MNAPLRRGLALLGLALVLACPRSGPAREPQRTRFAEDTHVFRRILFDFKLTPLPAVPDIDADPADTVLVVLGEPGMELERRRPGWLQEFVQKGGALLYATDHETAGVPGRELLQLTGFVVTGVPILLRDRNAGYRDLDYCPILRPARGAEPNLFRNTRPGDAAPLTVATNAPSYLMRNGPTAGQIETLANLPTPWTTPRRRGWYFNTGLPFAAGGEVGKGKVLLLADHSIFINAMMLADDNQNVEFTYNCLDWLRAKPNGWKRHKVLLVEDARVRTDLDVPLKNVPIDPAQLPGILYAHRNELAAGVEQELARLENNNALNEGLMDFLRSLGLTPERLERVAVIVLSALLVGLSGYWVMTRGRHRGEPTVLPLARAVAQHAPTAPLLEQRHQALLRGGNVWEAARGLARQWFASAGAAVEAGPPRVVSEGGWWERWVLRRRVRRLWRLAYDPRPVRVSLRALRRLFGELEDMSVALANGSLRLEA